MSRGRNDDFNVEPVASHHRSGRTALMSAAFETSFQRLDQLCRRDVAGVRRASVL